MTIWRVQRRLVGIVERLPPVVCGVDWMKIAVVAVLVLMLEQKKASNLAGLVEWRLSEDWGPSHYCCYYY